MCAAVAAGTTVTAVAACLASRTRATVAASCIRLRASLIRDVASSERTGRRAWPGSDTRAEDRALVALVPRAGPPICGRGNESLLSIATASLCVCGLALPEEGDCSPATVLRSVACPINCRGGMNACTSLAAGSAYPAPATISEAETVAVSNDAFTSETSTRSPLASAAFVLAHTEIGSAPGCAHAVGGRHSSGRVVRSAVRSAALGSAALLYESRARRAARCAETIRRSQQRRPPSVVAPTASTPHTKSMSCSIVRV